MGVKKKIEDFKKQAKEKNITRWNIHTCSMCGYQCGFIIQGDKLYYDNGCYCSMNPPTSRDWQYLANHYNMQENKKVIKEMDKFWGFK